MLSYRHGFHAGNHADVLKHSILAQVISHMTHKDTPFVFIDTHAGAGQYDLRDAWAEKNREYETGIARIWQASDLPDAMQPYVRVVRELNGDGELLRYPGSPWLATALLRAGDSARLFELHTNEYTALSSLFSRRRGIKVEHSDGFAALKAVLPPPQRRGVVLIDPSYEMKSDFRGVVDGVKSALRRFATGIYLVWYPVLDRGIVDRLERDFAALDAPEILLAELSVRPDAHADGLTGSGMIIVNPPWQLRESLAVMLPWLHRQLATDDRATYRLV